MRALLLKEHGGLENLRALMEMISRGEIRRVIDKVLPLAEAVERLRRIRDREVIGNVVVIP